MTDTIGPISGFYINIFSFNDNVVVIGGICNTRIKLNELAELFRQAPQNTVVNTILGGHQVGFDMTSDNRLTQYCLFDSDKLVDGWYLLRAFRFLPDEFGGSYPFRLELFYLGTDGFYVRGWDLEDIEEETSDWE